jgi:hypothetical protein
VPGGNLRVTFVPSTPNISTFSGPSILKAAFEDFPSGVVKVNVVPKSL